MERKNKGPSDDLAYWLMSGGLVIVICLILLQGVIPLYSIEKVGVLIGDILAPITAVVVFSFIFFQYRIGYMQWEYSKRLDLERDISEYRIRKIELFSEMLATEDKERLKMSRPDDGITREMDALGEMMGSDIGTLENLRVNVRDEAMDLALVIRGKHLAAYHANRKSERQKQKP